MNDLLWKSILSFLALIVGTVSVMLFKGKHDNPVEEISEMVIHHVSGIDIDLTPTSPEK